LNRQYVQPEKSTLCFCFKNRALVDKFGKNAVAFSAAQPCQRDARHLAFLDAVVQPTNLFTRKGNA